MSKATMQDVYKAIRDNPYGLPIAYNAFPEAPNTPEYCVYRRTRSRNFAADGVVYSPADVIEILLYENTAKTEAETVIENELTALGLYYDKTYEYLDDQKVYEVTYEVEVLT